MLLLYLKFLPELYMIIKFYYIRLNQFGRVIENISHPVNILGVD